MDDGRIAEGPAVPYEGTLGDELGALLDHLARSGLKIGPRERVAASALAASVTAARAGSGGSGAVTTLADLGPLLAPLLARSPTERETYDRVLAAYVPDAPRPEPSPVPEPIGDLPEPPPSRPWVWWGSIAVAVLVLGLVVWVLGPRLFEREKPKVEVTAPTTPTTTRREEPVAPTAAPVKVENKTLDRIVAAAERFEGAPTLEELAPGLAATSPIGWTADAYLIRLHELTGLPTATPLGLYLFEGAILARVAHALDRIEWPGREGTLDIMRPIARAKTVALNVAIAESILTGGLVGLFSRDILRAIAGPQAENKQSVHSPYVVAVAMFTLSAWPADWPSDKAGAIARIQRYLHLGRTGRDEVPTGPDAVDPHTIERGLAIAPPPIGRIFADPP